MDCPICFEAISKDTGQVTTSCGHTFHFKCLNTWFYQQLENDEDAKESCPCCRKEAGEFEKAVSIGEHEQSESESESEDDETAAFEGNWVRVGERRWVTVRSPQERMQILTRVERQKEEPFRIPPYSAENHALWVLRHMFDEDAEPAQPMEKIHDLDKPKMLRRREINQYHRARNYWVHLGTEHNLEDVDGYLSN